MEFAGRSYKKTSSLSLESGHNSEMPVASYDLSYTNRRNYFLYTRDSNIEIYSRLPLFLECTVFFDGFGDGVLFSGRSPSSKHINFRGRCATFIMRSFRRVIFSACDGLCLQKSPLRHEDYHVLGDVHKNAFAFFLFFCVGFENPCFFL